MDRVLMQVIFSLAKAGYPQYIEDIKERMRFEKELIPGMSLVTPWYVATQDGEGKHIYLFAAISSITKKLVFGCFGHIQKIWFLPLICGFTILLLITFFGTCNVNQF